MKINLIIPYKWAKAFSMFLYASELKREYEKRWHTVVVRQPHMTKITWIMRIDDMITRYISYPIYLWKRWVKAEDGVFHITDHSYTFLIWFLKRSKTIITCHDIIPLIFRKEVWWIAYYLFYLNVIALRKANHIVTDSESSKNDVITYLGVPQEKVTVVYIAYNKELFYSREMKKSMSLQKEKHKKGKFVLMLVWSVFYKNIGRILEAVHLLPEEIQKVISIKKVQEFTKNEKIYIDTYLSHIDIEVLASPKDQTIVDMYHASDLLVFTSLYEWFGLPILEAMACDVAVLTSPVSSIKEVWGDAAMYADPRDGYDIAKKIQYLYENTQVREKMIERWRRQIERFTWENCAEKMITLYSDIQSIHG